MRLPFGEFENSLLTRSFGSICAMSIIFSTLPAGAKESAVPWECAGFAGEAQGRCERILAELQQEKIAKLEKDLEVQRQTVQQLQQDVAQQASTTAELERTLTRKRSHWYGSPFVQIYPPFGLALRFGRDKYFGGTLFYGNPPYYGLRFYGHGHRRWHRY